MFTTGARAPNRDPADLIEAERARHKLAIAATSGTT
jgi:hypothetical protein